MGLQGPDWEKEEAGELAGWEGTSESQTWPGSWTEQRQSLLRSWVGGAKLKGLHWKGRAMGTLGKKRRQRALGPSRFPNLGEGCFRLRTGSGTDSGYYWAWLRPICQGKV